MHGNVYRAALVAVRDNERLGAYLEFIKCTDVRRQILGFYRLGGAVRVGRRHLKNGRIQLAAYEKAGI